ncbi:MAG TPA: CPBP family intramembrane glutamic endopeptidase, partial [Propionicimonas sp.]|nr:CPBP family intramembrane glutamic endopeptidase [Propionicimonas sp.]
LAARGDLSLPVAPLALTAIGGFGPLVAAVTLTARRSGVPGVTALFARLDPRRIPRRWFLAPLLLAATNLAPVGAYLLAGGRLPDGGAVLGAVLTVPVQLVLVSVVGGGLDEETGWRGYALPALLRTGSPAVAHVVLGVVWACWHLPLWLDPTSSQAAYPFGIYLVTTALRSVLIGWMYCGAGGSLALAVLAHAVSNSADGLRYQLLGPAKGGLTQQLVLLGSLLLVAAVIAAATRGRFAADVLEGRPRIPDRSRPDLSTTTTA